MEEVDLQVKLRKTPEAEASDSFKAYGVNPFIGTRTNAFSTFSIDTDSASYTLARRYIMSAVEDSLKRLQTDYIDLYQVHQVDPLTPMEETLRALDDLVRAGKVRYIGLSNHPAWMVAEAVGSIAAAHERDSLRLTLEALGRGIPVNVLAELDRKIDDGLPRTGVLRQGVTSGGTSIERSAAVWMSPRRRASAACGAPPGWARCWRPPMSCWSPRL